MSAMRRAAVLVGGLALIAVGVPLLVLPGPGWACIIGGLALLATEFPWAARLLEPVRRLVRSGSERFRRMSRGHQVMLVSCLVAVALVLSMLGAWLLLG